MGVYFKDPDYKLYLALVRIVTLCTFQEAPAMSVFVPPHALPWRKDHRALSICFIDHTNSWVAH